MTDYVDYTGAAPFPVSGIIDNFNRADENPLASGWTDKVLPTHANMQVVSNAAKSASGSTYSSAWWSNATYGPDCEAYVTLTTRPANGKTPGLYARVVNPGTSSMDGYFVGFTMGASDTYLIIRITNGANTVLKSGTHNIAAGDKFGIRCLGSVISLWHFSGGSWSLVDSVTDSTYASSGSLAMAADADLTIVLDDFGGGTVATIAPISTVTTPSSSEVHETPDSATVSTKATVTFSEIAAYVESAVVSTTTDISASSEIYTHAGTSDSSTISTSTTISSNEIANYVDSEIPLTDTIAGSIESNIAPSGWWGAFDDDNGIIPIGGTGETYDVASPSIGTGTGTGGGITTPTGTGTAWTVTIFGTPQEGLTLEAVIS